MEACHLIFSRHPNLMWSMLSFCQSGVPEAVTPLEHLWAVTNDWTKILYSIQIQNYLSDHAGKYFVADSNWSKYKAGLDVPEFHDTIEAFQDYNQTVIHKEGADLAIAGCDVSISL